MSDFLIGGIDPGLSGGLVVIDLEGTVIKYEKMPRLIEKNKKDDIDIVAVSMFFIDCSFVVSENVWASPASQAPDADGNRRTQGVAAMFNFGRGFGYIVSWLRLNYKDKHKLVVPTVWKRYHDLLKQDKKASKIKAVEISGNDFRATPRSTTPHEGICESFLIARYALDKIVKA